MFLSNNNSLTNNKSLSECTYELYEDIISFNEEYNSIKEEVILQEHSMLLEGNSLYYIQESISETASKIWQTIIKFLKGLKEKIVQVYNIVKKKVLEIIVKIKSFFTKGEDVVVVDIKEDVSKLQRLRAYVSNIGKVTKDNIMEHKKEIAAIVGVAAASALAYVLWKNGKDSDSIDLSTLVPSGSKIVTTSGSSALSSREQDLKILSIESPIAKEISKEISIVEALEGEYLKGNNSKNSNSSKYGDAEDATFTGTKVALRDNSDIEDTKAKVSLLGFLQQEDNKMQANILRKAAYMKGARGNKISRRTSSKDEIEAYEKGRSDSAKYKKDNNTQKYDRSFLTNDPHPSLYEK